MEEILEFTKKILSQSATIHIYSFPHFTLETFLAIVMFVIYSYLTLEVSKIAKRTLTLRPNTIIRKNIKGVNSSLSLCTSSSRCQHEVINPYNRYGSRASTNLAYRRLSTRCSSQSQMGWIMSNIVDVPSCGDVTTPRFDSVASMTPSEFVKREKERRQRERELHKSLTTLYDNVVERKYSENTLQSSLEMAKETTQCTKVSNVDLVRGVAPAAMTDSVIDLLEKIVISSSINNPLPFNGDITRLVLDAGDLNSTPPRSPDVLYRRCSSSSTSSSEPIGVNTKHNIANT